MKKTKSKLVIVESPTKARTIRKFLDASYLVESCMGHIRDLPKSKKEIPEKYRKESWAHLGVNVEKNFQPFYCLSKGKKQKIQALKKKLKEASELILATDEDREGESISWHLLEVLKPKISTKRIVFHEITQAALNRALKEFRNIDQNLVRAQEARRILDRLVGYTLSPLLWKKVAYGLSAGRVQSVAMNLIAKREHERLCFQKTSYWSLTALLKKKNSKETEKKDSHATGKREEKTFEAKLYSYKERKIATSSDFDSLTGEFLSQTKLSTSKTKKPLESDKKEEKKAPLLLSEQKANQILDELKEEVWTVTEVKERPFHRKPSPPFITSTLQQEANKRLNFSSKQSMDVAQKLYEKGLITYMRTDSTTLSDEALKAIRAFISKKYGQQFLPSQARKGGKKVKGAQEAHEAIRPAGTQFTSPEDTSLQGFERQLYELIWKRTLESQMKDAQYLQTQVKIKAGSALFTTSGMTMKFEGFLKVHLDEVKKLESKGQSSKFSSSSSLFDFFQEPFLQKLEKNEELQCQNLHPKKNETRPLPRYTEASLIQAMEKNGIGRPSTYVTIITTIQNRGYVRKEGRTLHPTFVSLVVSKLFNRYFPNYVDTEFTSKMEEALDKIAQGDLNWVFYLKSIYFGEIGLKQQVEVKEKEIDVESSRSIKIANIPSFIFRIGRYGAYVCCKQEGSIKEVCASIPEKLLPGDMNSQTAQKLIDQKLKGIDALGVDPKSGFKVYVLTGRYGPYVQLGEGEMKQESFSSKGSKKEKTQNVKPKRISLPEGTTPENLTLKEALELLSLPKTLGLHPETKEKVQIGLGRFGPYVVHQKNFRSIPRSKNLFDLSLDEALGLLKQEKKGRGRSRSTVIKTWKEKKGKKAKTIQLLSGPYGPYVQYDKKNISLPDNIKSEEVTLSQVLIWIKEKQDLFSKK